MNLGIASHSPSPKTQEMREIKKLLPSWSVSVSCVTEYGNWEF